MSNERFNKGLKVLNEIDRGAAQKVLDSLQDISPDFARFIIEFSYGDIFSRPALDIKTREIATVAVLAAMGTAVPQLKVHLHAALNVGWTQEQIVEAMIHITPYAGMPATLNGLTATKEVFRERANNN